MASTTVIPSAATATTSTPSVGSTVDAPDKINSIDTTKSNYEDTTEQNIDILPNQSPKKRKRSSISTQSTLPKKESSSKLLQLNPYPKLPRDSVLVDIPCNVTVDIGIAIRRTYAKRIKQFQNILMAAKGADMIGDSTYDNGNQNDRGFTISKSDQNECAVDEDEDDEEDDEGDNKSSTAQDTDQSTLENYNMPRKEQYGSMMDYLEAKYVKGVMIDDLDEKVRLHRQKKHQQTISDSGNIKKIKKKSSDGPKRGKNSSKAMSDRDVALSDVYSTSAAGSCYTDESGNFIDDSELRTEVLQQIMATSVYGTTKVEADSAAAAAACGEMKDGATYADNQDERKEKEGVLEDQDHGFFVNVGDLEMEEGWVGEEDEDGFDNRGWFGTASVKGKKRKRQPKDKPSTMSTNNPTSKTKKNKTSTNSVAVTKPTPRNSDSNKKKKSKTPTASSTSQAAESSKKPTNTSKTKSKTDKKATTTKTKSKTENKVSNSVDKAKSNGYNKEPTTPVLKSMTLEEKKSLKEIQKECDEKQKECKRFYQKCKSEISKMTEENLPRKRKKNAKVKVSVTVPNKKKGGDKITFSNPHVPGQKLAVTVPTSMKAGQVFKVSVPLPKITKATASQNKFTKSCIVALSEYSHVYDDWCQSEAKRRILVPKKDSKDDKVIPFKIGVERLKKYDKLLNEFPKDLEVKVDPTFLRLLVRRLKQNESKRLKSNVTATSLSSPISKSASTAGPSSPPASPVLAPRKTMSDDQMSPKVTTSIELEVPVKSLNFPSIKFCAEDFDVTE